MNTLVALTDALTLLYATTDDERYEAARRRAWGLYRNGQFHEAVEAAREALE